MMNSSPRDGERLRVETSEWGMLFGMRARVPAASRDGQKVERLEGIKCRRGSSEDAKVRCQEWLVVNE